MNDLSEPRTTVIPDVQTEPHEPAWWDRPVRTYCGYRYDGTYGVVPAGTPGAVEAAD